MKFDLQWLVEQLDGAPDADRLAERLTACGLLVELREAADGSELWDVDVTTNRPDAMNHRGLAREAAAATGARLKELAIGLEESDEPTAALATVAIEAPEGCTRFCSRVVRGVGHGPSPEWMQRRLERCGVRPISAVVDITNYVLLTLGQPLHAYDLERVAGRRLVARTARAGERLQTLDGEQRRLEPEMLVIADADGPVGLAGVMGGADSEIGPATTDVWLEAAHFDALTVRRMARRLGMHTEASHRFERGADPEMPSVAVDLAAALIARFAGGRVCRGRIDVRPRPWTAPTVTLSLSALAAFAGLAIPRDRVLAILETLEFAPRAEGDTVHCRVPSFRVDVECAADLYEEVIRHVGYDAVPAVLPVLSTAPGRRHPNWELVDRARDAAVAVGLYELATYSFVGEDDDRLAAELPLCPGDAMLLNNPLAQTQAAMRRSLLPGLVAAARDNLNQGERSLALFVQGRVFGAVAGAPREAERLAVLLGGGGCDPTPDALTDFAQLKGVVEAIVGRVGYPSLSWQRGGAPWLDPAEGAVITREDGQVVGVAGLLAPAMGRHFELREPVYLAELDLGAALEHAPVPSFAALPRFPSVVADMTVEHPLELEYRSLEAAVRELADALVESLELRARFAGKDLPAGTVRTTLRVVYRHPERSLTQDEVNDRQESLRRRLAERLGVRFA